MTKCVRYSMKFSVWPKMVLMVWLMKLGGWQFILHMAQKLEGDKKHIDGQKLVGVNKKLLKVWNSFFFVEFIEHCIEFGEWPKKQYIVWIFKNDPNRLNVAWNWYVTKNLAISIATT